MTEFSPRLPSLAGPTRRASAPSAATRRLPTALNAGHLVVLTSLAAMLMIRFFTEEIHVVPRAANFIDIPLLLVVGCFAAGTSLARASRSTLDVLPGCDPVRRASHRFCAYQPPPS